MKFRYAQSPAPLLLTATALALGLAGCGRSPGVPTVVASHGARVQAQAVPGELVVKLRPGSRAQRLQQLGLRTVGRVERLGVHVVKAADPAEALARLKADPEVAYAEPNYVARAIDLPAAAPALTIGLAGEPRPDELLKECWGIAKINAPAAWAVTPGSPDVKVAVVDTGIDYTHPDFGGRVARGRDFINNDDDAMDDHYHGTHCAGTIGAGLNNGGVVGVAPGVSLLAVKVLGGNGSGSYTAVANGMTFAADQGAAVISMSLGGSASSQVLEDAVKYCRSKGALVVAAMGNDNSESPSYPAALPGVMAVGATASGDTRSTFSNYGAHISVAAPGTNVYSTVTGGKYKSLSGTSMATPHVAGLCGLVKSRFPGHTADQLRKAVEAAAVDLGDKGFDKQFGHGRIDAAKALASALR